MQKELLKWLKDVGELDSARLISECSVDLLYVDTLFEMSSDRMTDLMDAQIGIPGKYYLKLQLDFQKEIKIIETQLMEVATALGMHIRSISWNPKIDTDKEVQMKISIIVRQAIFDEITLNKISWSGRLEEPDFLNRIFDLSKMPSFDSRFDNAYDDIHKHRIMNYDWEDDWVFTDRRFNLLHCEEEIFLKFLSLTINPVSRTDDEGVGQLIEIYNRNLSESGIEFYEKSKIAGKPIYGYREIAAGNASTSSADAKQRKIALVVGCSQYEFAGLLENPLNDAVAIKQNLESLGFDVMYAENPNLKDLKIKIDDFGTELEKYDVGLFYFAGHGVQVKGLNYLIPVDANLKSERTVEYDCVQVDRILSHMENAKTSVNLIILDACRNNPFERSWGRDLSQRGFAVMDAPKGSLIAYSTSPGKTASDGEGKNGLYTGELIAEIKSVNLTITQLFQKVRKAVMEKSKDTQVPWESTSLTADFYFNRK
ncbi:caspase family protein [Haoranjiania flava]|uniref:Caspase family protein n=1 Tax=Haoranjiania flava TaxID=1856322 RepID=A0AAE3LJZ0_9BACT|nr:caspase family protein [Haoranjiania flava]MCU7693854.1 caspase family protein [Haoranjiania flava]